MLPLPPSRPFSRTFAQKQDRRNAPWVFCFAINRAASDFHVIIALNWKLELLGVEDTIDRIRLKQTKHRHEISSEEQTRNFGPLSTKPDLEKVQKRASKSVSKE